MGATLAHGRGAIFGDFFPTTFPPGGGFSNEGIIGDAGPRCGCWHFVSPRSGSGGYPLRSEHRECEGPGPRYLAEIYDAAKYAHRGKNNPDQRALSATVWPQDAGGGENNAARGAGRTGGLHLAMVTTDYVRSEEYLISRFRPGVG